ncbi:MAG: hypothetical protein JXR91_13815 [Deltaproteobacteria bacterium]|nr:hypothetical protein [Deltaproteobacteria bacterium]
MSLRFEKKNYFCTHTNKNITLFITYKTPDNLPPDAELTFVKTDEECLERKNCKDNCPGESTVLKEI